MKREILFIFVSLFFISFVSALPSITSPVDGSTLSGASESFSWETVAGATAYWLWTGSCNSPDLYGCGDDYYNSGELGSEILSAIEAWQNSVC